VSTLDTQSYENVRDQIGFCGIWCGSCVVGNGTLRELTKRYEEMIAAYGLREWGPRDLDYDELSRALASIEGMPDCPGCLEGGGRDDCEIRACALARGLESCVACDEFGRCGHAAIVERMRSGAVAAGLFVKAAGTEGGESLEEWERQLERRWPCCILFMDGT
jgi:hypothetical protein